MNFMMKALELGLMFGVTRRSLNVVPGEQRSRHDETNTPDDANDSDRPTCAMEGAREAGVRLRGTRTSGQGQNICLMPPRRLA